MLPVLDMVLPRPVTTLHQVEVTSRCDLRCVYCVSPDIVAGKYPDRRAVDMTREHFEAALSHAAHYVKRGTQNELNLAGIGESTLHPMFPDFLRLARRAVGPNVSLLFATNGLNISKLVDGKTPADVERAKAIVDAIVETKTTAWVSLHRPERGAIAGKVLEDRGRLGGFSNDPSMNANDWAGQVKWMNTTRYQAVCTWLRAGACMVMADGRVTACCLDGQASGVIGHVNDAHGSLMTKPYKLCPTCHHEVGIRGYDQRGVGV